MQEQFIPYEQALALKELGFNEPCLGYYIELRNPQEGIITIDKCENDIDGVLAPLWQQAFDWFRDKHNLFIEITLWGDGIGYICQIKEIKQKEFIEVHSKILVDTGLPTFNYEKARLACLKNLIELVKNQ